MTTANEDMAFLAKLEAKRDALNQTIESYRAYLGLEGNDSIGSAGTGIPKGITSTTFWGKTIPDAAKIYLQMVRPRPQATAEIAEALLRGGMETKAKDFPATVLAMLRRTESQTDEIIRVPSGEWALPEWFPDRPRRKKGQKDKGVQTGGDDDGDNDPE